MNLNPAYALEPNNKKLGHRVTLVAIATTLSMTAIFGLLVFLLFVGDPFEIENMALRPQALLVFLAALAIAAITVLGGMVTRWWMLSVLQRQNSGKLLSLEPRIKGARQCVTRPDGTVVKLSLNGPTLFELQRLRNLDNGEFTRYCNQHGIEFS